jgi:hypothetical protein
MGLGYFEPLKSLDSRRRGSVFLLKMDGSPSHFHFSETGRSSAEPLMGADPVGSLANPIDGGDGKMENKPFPGAAGNMPIDILQEFVCAFARKGWLNHALRIMHRDRRYRIFCSETEFIAHRINDNCAVSWGFPCWAVCIVTQDQIIEDSDLSGFASIEPGVQDWLRCIAEGDFQIL